MTRDEAAAVVLRQVIQREGGVADVGDGAGITRYGQTPGWLLQFGFATPETKADALANYQTFLVRTRLIGVCDEADVFADSVIDFAVNAGHPTAISVLQKALGVSVDTVLGPETQAAIDVCDRKLIAAKVVAGRVRHYGQIITGNPGKHARYAAGWMNRVSRQIEMLA